MQLDFHSTQTYSNLLLNTPINVKITKIAVLIHIAPSFLKMIEQKFHSQLEISLNDLFLEFLMETTTTKNSGNF